MKIKIISVVNLDVKCVVQEEKKQLDAEKPTRSVWEAPARGFSIKLLQIKFANVRLSRPSFGAHTLGIRRPYVYHIDILLCTFFHTEVLS